MVNTESLTLRFYSNRSTYCHTFPSKYHYSVAEGLMCVFRMFWPWKCATQITSKRMSFGIIVDTLPGCPQPVTELSQGAGGGQFCWVWTSSGGQPWCKDSHQLGSGFLRTVQLSEVFPLQSSFHLFLSSQMSALHLSLKTPMAYSCSACLYPSKTCLQSSSSTCNSVLVSTF